MAPCDFIRIKTFDEINQAYYLLYIPAKIQSLSTKKYSRLERFNQGCLKVLSCPKHYVVVIKWYSQTPFAYLALFASDTCVNAADRKEVYVLRKL
jgi:hypothetical protein